jgi:hypothetical protein
METPFPLEVLRRYGHAIVQARWAWGGALLAAVLVMLPPVRALLARRSTLARWGLVGLAIAGGVIWAWSLRWLCDDAFISFRYAENLARGQGLVFNPGERVEGYTNPLWTVLLAGAIKLGLHPGQVSLVLSLASFAGVIALLARLAQLAAPERSLAVPIASLVAAGSYTLASFATSGLETMFAAMLVLLAVERAEGDHPVAAGLAGVAALLSHPDHGLFYAALGGALLLDRHRRKQLVLYALPFLLVFVPFFLWRWHYYGQLVPNTFYAKSGGRSYWNQGGIYLLVGFVTASLWTVLPLAALGAWRHRSSLTARYAMIALPLYLVYVAKIGGDFMQGRLLTPALALGFLLAELGLRALVSEGRWPLALGMLLPMTLAAVPTNVIAPGEKKWNLADERTFYPLQTYSPVRVGSIYSVQADGLVDTFVSHGVNPRLAIGCVGIVGYQTRLPIFDMLGLTSVAVAHQPVLVRGRPGHEKIGTAGQVLTDGVVVSEIPVFPPPYDVFGFFNLGGFSYSLVRWDPAVARAVPPSSGLLDFPTQLDARLPALGRRGPERLECDLWHLREFYFSRNPDPLRARRVIDAAVSVNGLLRGVEPLLLDARDPSALGYRQVRAFSFDSRAGWEAVGEGLRGWPSAAPVPGQSSVYGNRGPFIDTFTVPEGDSARGRLVSPPFTISGDVITAMVGGGMDAPRVHVALVIDGQAVRVATGCATELMGRRAWNVRDYKGLTGRIELVDSSPDGWGHLVADEVVEWAAPR